MTDEELIQAFGDRTDKFSLNYYPVYKEILAGYENPSILEIGVAWGGSYQMWQAMFPESIVVGVDILLPSSVTGKLVQADQSQSDLAAKVSEHSSNYDLVVDDASHMGSQSEVTFKLLWPLVKPGGWYVLEDWTVGLESNPYYPLYEGDSMLRLAQSFTSLIQPSRDLRDMSNRHVPAGDAGSVDEVRYRYGLAMVHKKESQ